MVLALAWIWELDEESILGLIVVVLVWNGFVLDSGSVLDLVLISFGLFCFGFSIGFRIRFGFSFSYGFDLELCIAFGCRFGFRNGFGFGFSFDFAFRFGFGFGFGNGFRFDFGCYFYYLSITFGEEMISFLMIRPSACSG
jgi:hypothetical protein